MAKKITLFHPYVPKSAIGLVGKTLNGRWLGQGPRVTEFEALWKEKISKPYPAVAVNTGTNALHLAYILSGIREGDEVIAPIFTYPGANMALLYQRAKIVFADVKKGSLNIDPDDIARKITPRTKAIVVVHYGGVPCDMDKIQEIANHYKVSIIGDAAYGHGTTYKGQHVGGLGDFAAFSFQAVKMISTVSGGMLTIKNPKLQAEAKSLRWFGINRTSNLDDRGINDIHELGYGYRMSDVEAVLGIEALKKFDDTLKHYQNLADIYKRELKDAVGIKYIGGNALSIVLADNRKKLKSKLAKHGIESNQVDFRNDIYSIFGGRVKDCPNMDELESKYLVLPMHYRLQESDIRYICEVIKNGE